MSLLFGHTMIDYFINGLDILIVVFTIYMFLVIFRQSRAMNILLGFVAIFIVYIIADIINLQMVSWILRNILNYSVLIVIILFQEEIRRFLLLLGRAKFITKPHSEESVEEVIEAVRYFSDSKTGCLIIFKRTVNLGDRIDDFVRLQTKVHSELVKSIFYKGSPLHDGAVVIENDMIIKARAIIQMKQNLDPSSVNHYFFNGIKKSQGTRHRAAKSITDGNDAVCLVVSEETGAISLAKEGVLESNINIENLKGRLNEYLS